jgi:SAM-dependent methyltransferase
MSHFVEPDWNARYVSRDVPWDCGHPSTELRRVVEETDELPRGRLLELGCGTGTNAIYLAQIGFQVTAVDGSSEAIARANARLETERSHRRHTSVEFHRASVVDLPAALSDGETNRSTCCSTAVATTVFGESTCPAFKPCSAASLGRVRCFCCLPATPRKRAKVVGRQP